MPPRTPFFSVSLERSHCGRSLELQRNRCGVGGPPGCRGFKDYSQMFLPRKPHCTTRFLFLPSWMVQKARNVWHVHKVTCALHA